jgi:hypothetical protein
MSDKPVDLKTEARAIAGLAMIVVSIGMIGIPKDGSDEAKKKYTDKLHDDLTRMIEENLEKIVERAKEEAVQAGSSAKAQLDAAVAP